MQCPQCGEAALTPVKLEPSLAARGCRACNGALLDLVQYRLWRERHADKESTPASVAEVPTESTRAMTCAHCSRIMLRFRYTEDTNHVLDVCTYCDDVWLQDGEWEYLKAHQLSDELTQIFTESWQRQLRAGRGRARLHDHWDDQLGAELHQEIAEVRAWLEGHEKSEQLKRYLWDDDPYQA